jgi:hypothetical protein
LDEHQRLIDQSRILIRRAKRQRQRSQERIDRTEHRWLRLPLGRVCMDCRTAQGHDEYDDDVRCAG